MGRGAERQGVQQEAELLTGLLFAQTDGLEKPRLGIGVVDPDAASAQFEAVEDDVVGLGPAAARVAFQPKLMPQLTHNAPVRRYAVERRIVTMTETATLA